LIEEIRERIDKIDSEILALLEERFSLSEEIGKEKRKHKLGISQPQRKRKILENLINSSKLEPWEIEKIWKVIFEISEKRQRME